jgi:uncharacterized membrane protein HdeD (DUF308 family)
MATTPGVLESPRRIAPHAPVWVALLLGIVLIAAGLFVLGDVALASVISAFAIGAAAVIGGGFEIAHAFWTPAWGSFAWRLLLGILYIVFGIALMVRPDFSSFILTYLLGFALVISGFVRVVLGYRYGGRTGRLLLLSGLVGIAAGIMILAHWPRSGLWAIGLLVGIDLIAHGLGWLAVAWARRSLRNAVVS